MEDTSRSGHRDTHGNAFTSDGAIGHEIEKFPTGEGSVLGENKEGDSFGPNSSTSTSLPSSERTIPSSPSSAPSLTKASTSSNFEDSKLSASSNQRVSGEFDINSGVRTPRRNNPSGSANSEFLSSFINNDQSGNNTNDTNIDTTKDINNGSAVNSANAKSKSTIRGGIDTSDRTSNGPNVRKNNNNSTGCARENAITDDNGRQAISTGQNNSQGSVDEKPVQGQAYRDLDVFASGQRGGRVDNAVRKDNSDGRAPGLIRDGQKDTEGKNKLEADSRGDRQIGRKKVEENLEKEDAVRNGQVLGNGSTERTGARTPTIADVLDRVINETSNTSGSSRSSEGRRPPNEPTNPDSFRPLTGSKGRTETTNRNVDSALWSSQAGPKYQGFPAPSQHTILKPAISLHQPKGYRHPMETLAEPGVLPHNHYPMSMSGYYSKQDSSSYYFPNSNRSPQGYGMYPGYPPVPEGEAAQMMGQHGIFHSHQRYPSGDDRRGDRNGPYFSPQHPQNSPRHLTPPYHRQIQQSPHRLPSSSYPPPHPSPSSKDGQKGEERKGDEDISASATAKKLDNSFGPESAIGRRSSSSERHDFHGSKDNIMYDEKIHSSPYHYSKHGGRHSAYLNDDHRPVYSQGSFMDLRNSVKDAYSQFDNGKNNSSSAKAEAVPVAYEDERFPYPEGRPHDGMSAQFRERLERSTSHEAATARLMAAREQERDSDGRPNRAMTLDPSLYRRESAHGIYNTYNQKQDEMMSKLRDRYAHPAMSSPYYYQDKDKESSMMSSPMKQSSRHNSGAENNQRLSRQELMERRMMMSPERYHQDLPSQEQRQNMMLSPSARERHDSRDGVRSPAKPGPTPDHQPPSQNASNLYGSTPGKSSSLPPVSEQRSSSEAPPSSSWSVSPFSGPSHFKEQNQDESSVEEPKDRHGAKANSDDPDRQSSPTKIGPFAVANRDDFDRPSKSSSSAPATYPSLTGSKISPPVTPNKMSPPRRSSLDSSINRGSGSDGNDGTLTAKKEVFSDDGGDDSNSYHRARPRSMSPPSPDASMTYPPHYGGPFFSSPGTGGSQSGHRMPFGSPRGPYDHHHPGAGFPFGKDLSGRFPIPGLTPEMAMGGHMPPSGPPFMGSVPAGGMAHLPGGMNEDKDIFFCHLCSYSGKSKPEFDSHMNVHFEYNCPHCDYTSRTEGRLKRHIKDFHSDDSSRRSMPGRPKVYKCKQCPFSATEKDKFWEHARSHIKDDKLLQCPKCPFVTEYKHHLEYHLRNHFGSKPFKCNKCNYSCVNKSMLNSHMKSHTNVYQYRCSECTYATKYCHSLKLHLKKYNHKPATVLNQDGSLPQGLDVDASGLSVITKRGPPRGPRGPRKDKNDPYMSPGMFGMPPVPMGVPNMGSLINSMVPFWPMMTHAGIPGHPQERAGMLPGMGNLAHHMAMRDMGDSRDGVGMEGSNLDMSENSNEDTPMKEDYFSCRLCSFSGESTEALCLHFVQEHKDEAKEVARAYGISEEDIGETMAKIPRPEAMMDRRRLSEPPMEADNDHGSSEFHRRNSIAGLLSGANQVQGDSRMGGVAPWPSSSYSENSRLMEMCYPGADGNTEEEEGSSAPSGEIGILEQMTLKFGNGTPHGKTTFPSRDEDERSSNANEESEANESRGRRHHKETALDLSKPKSVSPPMFSNPSSPKRDDSDATIEEDDDKVSGSADEAKSLSRVTDLLFRKRPAPEAEDTGSPSMSDTSAIVPRKRSRKGKAYKLDTLCLKLQERQTGSPLDSDDNESDMEMTLERFQPLQAVVNEENTEDKATEGKRKGDGSTEEEEETPETEAENNFNMKDAEFDEGVKSDGEDTDTYESDPKKDGENDNGNAEKENTDSEIVIKEEITYPQNLDESEEGEEKKKESGESEKSDSFSSEVESEFENLQRSLNILNNGMNPEGEGRSSKDDFEKEERRKEVEEDSDRKIVNRNTYLDQGDEKGLSNKEIHNDGELGSLESPENNSEDEKTDQVEMINTVLENRKKPLPPAVQRGTELAWKLLTDPVNPVTSLPLPVASTPPPQQQQHERPHLPSSSMAAITSSTPSLRNGMRPQPPSMPHYSHMQTPPHLSQPLMAMKPPMPIPLPPTPMAYIPPTNRMISEPAMLPPSSAPKTSSKELYECTYCDLSFKDCVMYTVHMGYHSNRNPFKCNNCGIICRDKVEFFLHIARSPHA